MPPPRKDGTLKGLTLAEVLITLGIIGVVAALTLPTLIAYHQKQVTVNKLKKFYTNINQAVRLSELENDSSEFWEYPDNNYENNKAFFEKYIGKYMQYVSIEPYKIGDYSNILVKFADGSAAAFRTDKNGTDINFITEASSIKTKNPKRNSFGFMLNKKLSIGAKTMVEPYTFEWDGTREHLISHPRYGCSQNGLGSYCAKLIQYDGWQISKDYPW